MNDPTDPPDTIAPRVTAPPLALALLIVFAAHALALFGDFFIDDYFNLKNAFDAGWSWSRLSRHFIINQSLIHDGIEYPPLAGFTFRYFRPLFLASLLVDRALWAMQPWGYHLTNLLLHLAVVSAFYGVLRELLPGRRAMAWFGALLYGIMPYQGMTVAWVSGRTELLPGLAMMVGLWGWLRFARTRSWGLYGLSLAAAAAGLLSKENAIIFPFVLLAAWLWVGPRPRPSVWLLAPFALLAVLYFPVRHFYLDGFPLPPPCFYYHSPSEPGFVRWALAKSVCAFYGALLQVPLTYPTEMLLSNRPGVLAVAVVLTATFGVLLGRFVRGRQDDAWRRRAWFAIAWIVLGLAPTAPIFLVSLYFYFPLAGVCLLYLTIWQRLTERGRPRWLMRPWGRRVALVLVLALWMLSLNAGNTLLLLGSRGARSHFNQILALAGKPADGDRLFLIDLPVVSIYSKIALQFRWPDRRFECHILSISPYLVKNPPTISRLEQSDERTLELTALRRLYLGSATDRPPDPIEEGQVFSAPGYRVGLREVEPGGLFGLNSVRRYVFHFDAPTARPGNTFLRYRDGRFEEVVLR